jgi:hypothetical protein
VNVRQGLPIEIVIADAGPLISLAACGRLSLLRAFQRPVRVADVVKAECLRFPDKVGASTLASWFSSADCTVEVTRTPLLRAWEDAVSADETIPGSHQAVGLGDAATTWLLRQIQDRFAVDSPTLVLTEDGPFGDGVLRDQFPEVHALSTRAFLRTLENFGIIPSAEAVISEIAEAGRSLARYMADRPGRTTPGAQTTWSAGLSEFSQAPNQDAE